MQFRIIVGDNNMTDRDYSPSDSEHKIINKERKRIASNRKTNMQWLIKTRGIAEVFLLLMDKDEAYHLNDEAGETPTRFKSIYK